jgi:polygalacturonase
MTVDDAMCAKARYTDMANVVFSNNVNYTSACGVKVGMQCVGNYSNILFRNCDVIHCRRGIGIDTRREGDENHPIKGIVFKDIRIEETESTPGEGDYCVDIVASLADVSDISIVNCNCRSTNKIRFAGSYRIKNIVFEGLMMNGKVIKSYDQVDINNDNSATYFFK